MKFGQRMRAEEAACLLGNRLELADRFVNYKCLKKLIKPLTAQTDSASQEAHEQTFVRALLHEINQVGPSFPRRCKSDPYFAGQRFLCEQGERIL